ncbi:hypothetical protein DFP72DRAFT_436199 [Ephemerocybe angulata]|uniref:NAD(P)-binding protein n=1 Tax=Ephemerocybe angulata TaxID=980116 RepID=A0A8H6M5N1_9AGAR|nr:hypothetical protein DFP72DRAFT_436199 [Tulosesus angulatus]
MTQWTFSRFASSQWAAVPPVASGDLNGKTIVVIGGNAGIGFEAAKHYCQMNPDKVILACRSEERAEAAVKSLREETNFERVEVSIVDLSNFNSVKALAKQLNEEDRLDILVENAGILPPSEYTPMEDSWESTLQVNHISLSLLSILLLPKMISTAERFNTHPRLLLVGSDVHMLIKFDKDIVDGESPLKKLSSIEYCTPESLQKRYGETKLLNLLFVRALSDRLPTLTTLIPSCVNPGFCCSSLRKSSTMTGLDSFKNWAREKVFARTAEEGSRQIIFASVAGEDPASADEEQLAKLKGAYISNSEVAEPSDYVLSEEGKEAQDKLWTDLIKELAVIEPKVLDIVARYLPDLLISSEGPLPPIYPLSLDRPGSVHP